MPPCQEVASNQTPKASMNGAGGVPHKAVDWPMRPKIGRFRNSATHQKRQALPWAGIRPQASSPYFRISFYHDIDVRCNKLYSGHD